MFSLNQQRPSPYGQSSWEIWVHTFTQKPIVLYRTMKIRLWHLQPTESLYNQLEKHKTNLFLFAYSSPIEMKDFIILTGHKNVLWSIWPFTSENERKCQMSQPLNITIWKSFVSVKLGAVVATSSTSINLLYLHVDSYNCHRVDREPVACFYTRKLRKTQKYQQRREELQHRISISMVSSVSPCK